MNRRWAMLVLAVAWPATSIADIELQGAQHTGDNNDGAAIALLGHDQPIKREFFQVNPSHFDLSNAATITGLRLNNLRSLDGNPRFEIDGNELIGSFDGSTGTLSLTQALTLTQGEHTFAVDSGCLDPTLNPTAPFSSATCNEDNIYWSSVSLLTGDISTSQSFNQRRHVGDFTEVAPNDQYRGSFYPDAPEGAQVSEAIVLERPRLINNITMYNIRLLRNLNVSVGGTFFGTFNGTGSNHASLALSNGSFATLPVGTHTLSITAQNSGSPSDAGLDDVSWDDIIVRFAETGATLPNHFNATDTGAAATGPITTKLAGSQYTLDIHALAADDSPTGGYQGTVTLELLDARDDSGALDIYGCRNSWPAVQNLGSRTFSSTSTITVPNLIYANALRVARVRITDTALNLSTCSLDAFAIRPASFDIAVTDATDSTPGTARVLNTTAPPPSAGPFHRAGQPFTISVTPRDPNGNAVSGLDINPDMSISAILPATVDGVLSVGSFTSSGNKRVSNDARYSEVGAFQLDADLSAFSNVDLADTPAAMRTPTPASISVGRFVPNHFAVSQNNAEFAPACVNHNYLGQTFGFATQPTLTLTAQNALGATTSNYEGSLNRLSASSASLPTIDSDQGVLQFDTPSRTVNSIGGGISLLTINASNLRFTRGTPVAAFSPAIAITTSITDADGVAALANPQQIGQPTPGNGIAFIGGNGSFRHALLSMDNAYGSPLLDLDVPIKLQYWADLGGGQSGYTADTSGDCVPAIVTGSGVNLTPNLSGGTTSAGTPSFANGTGAITLSAPGQTAEGFVDVELALPAGNDWLLDGANPTARASFGLQRQPNTLIHYREVIR